MKRRFPTVLFTALLIAPPTHELSMPPMIQTKTWAQTEIRSKEAWQITKGSKKIIVAIIDTGADINHPDLKENIWQNLSEIPNNGMDDDGNGFVDDFHGWNFVSHNSDLTDNHGHGTHISGIVGAKGDKALGVAPEVSLMILKYFDPKNPGSDSVAQAISAMKYAIKMGANIINFSAGGPYFSEEEYAVLKEANEKGVLVIAAAGNEKNNSDVINFFPADYALPNILSVTAIDESRQILNSSNYGERTVDIAAPGRDIYSTLPKGNYGRLSGTSQATAFATGVAALLMSDVTRAWTPEKIIEHLVRTGEPEPSLAGKTRCRTRLNSYRALAIHSQESGTRITLRHENDPSTEF